MKHHNQRRFQARLRSSFNANRRLALHEACNVRVNVGVAGSESPERGQEEQVVRGARGGLQEGEGPHLQSTRGGCGGEEREDGEREEGRGRG